MKKYMTPSFFRNLLVVFLDVVFAYAAFYFTVYAIEWEVLDRFLTSPHTVGFWAVNAIYLALCIINFAVFRTFQPSWRYTSFSDLLSIAYVAVYTNLSFLLSLFLLRHVYHIGLPLRVTTLIIATFIFLTFLTFPRVLYRYFMFERKKAAGQTQVILFGNLTSIDLFLRYNKTRENPFKVDYAVVTDKKEKHSAQKIHGVRVLTFSKFMSWHGERAYREGTLFIVVDARLFGSILEQIFDAAKSHDLETLRVADLNPLQTNQLTLKPVAIEDLLGRERVELTNELPATLIHDKTVLITGAGGSIGSEIVTQIMKFGPKRALILDQSEYFLYEIDQQLRQNRCANEWIPLMADVSDQDAMRLIFKKYRPHVIFHAAAMKHVPLSEVNPKAAFENNVIGTWNVAKLAMDFQADSMILISTDKAVNPSNTMGLTKRIAEIICQACDLSQSKTRFAAVRFGNVLGSRGSVIPLFQSQIARGGPVTVTDKDMTRFFMTIQEAVSLVLQAAALGTLKETYQGGVFVLDMGEPVRVVKMAEKLIELSGYKPYTQIPIVFTGMRAGEKLNEELHYKDEKCQFNVIDGVHFIDASKAKEMVPYKDVDAFVKQVKDLFEDEDALVNFGYQFIVQSNSSGHKN